MPSTRRRFLALSGTAVLAGCSTRSVDASATPTLAYSPTGGGHEFTFDPPSQDAWPEAATDRSR